MKYWKHLTFLPKLREEVKEVWLIDREINEKSLNTDAKYLTECKFLRPIWHSEEEILNWVRNEQLAGRIEIDSISTEELNEKPKVRKIEEFKRITTKLIEKEETKDKQGNDLLILTFEGLERKLTAFIRKLVNRKDELKVGDSYRINYGSNRNETDFNKDILLDFRNLNDKNQNKEMIKVKNVKLLKREDLKNNSGEDYLLLIFENVKEKILVRPNKFKFDNWAYFEEGREYDVSYLRDKSISENNINLSKEAGLGFSTFFKRIKIKEN